MCSVRFVDVYVRFGVNITPADLLVAGVFTTMHALCFDHLVSGVSHTATSTSAHYSFPTLLFPGKNKFVALAPLPLLVFFAFMKYPKTLSHNSTTHK